MPVLIRTTGMATATIARPVEIPLAYRTTNTLRTAYHTMIDIESKLLPPNSIRYSLAVEKLGTSAMMASPNLATDAMANITATNPLVENRMR